MGDIFQLWNRPEGALDESVDAFLNRRFHPLFSRVCGSALVHGIYAADSRLLSVRTAFPKLWELEEKGGRGGVIWAMLFRSKAEREREKQAAEENRRRYELGDTTRLMDGVAVYSFRNGMSTLANALEQHIGKNPNIRVLRDTEITSLAHNADHGFDVGRPTFNPSTFSHLGLDRNKQ
jgi:oxygen-dependent protoporphyrinogen oxidase